MAYRVRYIVHSCGTCLSISLSRCYSSAHICHISCSQIVWKAEGEWNNFPPLFISIVSHVHIGNLHAAMALYSHLCACVELWDSGLWFLKRIICYAINHTPESIMLFCNMSCDLFSVTIRGLVDKARPVRPDRWGGWGAHTPICTLPSDTHIWPWGKLLLIGGGRIYYM